MNRELKLRGIQISALDTDQFYSNVVYRSDSECWGWNGLKNGKGYARIQPRGHNGEFFLAHRFSWTISNGENIPDGILVLHRCDNRECTNPDHLFLGTNRDNTMDMMNKGRDRHNVSVGEDRYQSKLTEEKVREIRRRVSSGETKQSLAIEFGVSRPAVYSAVLRKTWAHVD